MNLMNVIKVMNFSGAGETSNFSFTFVWRGLQRPEPAAVHDMHFGGVDPLSKVVDLFCVFPGVPSGARSRNLLFTTGIGTALSPRNVGRTFDEAIVRAGVPRMRLHDLRHVSASLDL